MLDLGDYRTEFLLNLISVFEQNEDYERFKINISNLFFIKEEFDFHSALKDGASTKLQSS